MTTLTAYRAVRRSRDPLNMYSTVLRISKGFEKRNLIHRGRADGILFYNCRVTLSEISKSELYPSFLCRSF